MTQNQSNKNYCESLNQCRKAIDEIDNQILQMLERRMNIVNEVKKIKENNGEKFFIKSAREADMIRDLIAKSAKILPKNLIVDIWRKIITSSNLLEQNLKIALHNPQKIADFQYILREYYNNSLAIASHDNVNNVILEIEKNTAQLAVFELPNHENKLGENWWINLANSKSGLRVFAKIPFLTEKNQANLVVAGIKTAEKSQQDATLFCVELADSFSANALLKEFTEQKIEAKILKNAKVSQINEVNFYLLEAQGFFDENSVEVLALKSSKIKPFVRVIGNYATGF